MGIAQNPFDIVGAADRTWTFASCVKCRQMAVVAPTGQVMCQTCMDRANELQRLLASVARGVTYPTLRAALAGTSGLHKLRVAA